jgi:transcription elongation factor GreA
MTRERTVQLTAEGKARLEEELATLRHHRLPELAARIQEATEHGDVSDNSEYEEMKGEWVVVDQRIRDLESTLERAEVIHHVVSDTIGLGSRVTLRSDDGVDETWVLVRREEANTLDGTISTESPVGQALLGRRLGESAIVKTPSGPITYHIISVQ